MPLLPTIEVTQDQADKLTLMFGSSENYLKWLRNKLKEEIIQTRARVISSKAEQDIQSVFPAVDTEFPDLQNV